MQSRSQGREQRLLAEVEAEIEHRERLGQWKSAIQPHTAYQHDPLRWIVEKLEVPEHTLRWSLNPGYENHQWDGDRDPLVKLLEYLAQWDDIGVEAATGTQKTFTAACIVYWFLACFEDSIVLTVAPREDQLLLHIWKEIGRLWPRFQKHFPNAQLLGSGKIRMKEAVGERETWAATAFICGVAAEEDVAQRAAGSHAEHMLWITEETPGISLPIMRAIGETRTDDHNLHLALGNPDHRNDALHRFCFNEREEPQPGVHHVRISAFDHPNIVTGQRIVPGAIGRNRLDRRIKRLGKGSRLYQSRIRGISPAEAEDALIRWEWCVAAAKKYEDERYRAGPLGLGVDVADAPEGDPAAVAYGQGACCTLVEAWNVRDANEVAERVYLIANNKDHPIDGRYIGLDPVGVGASAKNELRRRGLKVRFISGGTKYIPGLDQDTMWSVTEPDLETGRPKPKGPVVVEAEEFDGARSQVWWKLREDLRMGRVALPFDEELFTDLTTPTYTTRNGKICVERKEEIVRRLRRSPNKGDAVAYWNFVRPRQKRTSPKVQQVVTKDRDLGLEKLLTRHFKRQVREQRVLERHLRRLRRGR